MNEKNGRILTCPWFTLSDRKALYRQLFEGNKDEKMKAIRRIDAWKARSYPHVPLGIEVTAALIHVLVLEDFDAREKPASGVLESMFSMALVRFVNLVTEVGKATRGSGSGAVSINSIAAKIGVPEWIVDLRHAATHSVLPSLRILKTAAVWCLDWVKTNYWLAEDEFIEDVVKMPAMFSGQSVREALRKAKADLMTMSIRDRSSKKDSARKEEAKNRLNAVMKTIMTSTNGRDLARMLTGDGLIFPESRLSLLHSSELEKDPCLSMRQFDLWWPVLHLLGKSGYLVDLIEALIAEVNRRPRIRGKFASTWIKLIISKFGLLDKLKTKDWKGYIRLIKILLKTSPSHARLAIGHLPKEKIEALTVLASRRASLTSGRCPVVEEPHRSPAATNDRLFAACPLGMLPEQLDATALDLDLPSLVDCIYDQQKTTDSNDSAARVDSRRVYAAGSPLPSAAWLL